MLALLLTAATTDALDIYRIGGAHLAPPPEADEPGVNFIQLDWDAIDPDAGGVALDVDFAGTTIQPQRRDPTFNLAPTVGENGGFYIQAGTNGQVFDGDTSSVWTAPPYLCAQLEAYWHFCTDDFGTVGTANIDLGGSYSLDRIRIVSGLRNPGRTVQAVRVYVADAEPPGRPSHWHPAPYSPYVAEVRDNRDQVLDIPMPDQGEVGFVQVSLGEHIDNWEVHEIEVYAKGFVQRATYVSDVIDLGRRMAWGQIRWSGERPGRARVAVQSRSGEDDSPVRYFRFTGRGDERAQVDRATYSSLRPGEKAGTAPDTRNWDFWASYDFSDSAGTPVVSTSPRQYLQLQVDFEPNGDDAGQVQFLEFRASEPLATNLVGEVWPVEAKAGQPTTFSYILRPTLGPEDAGFDMVDIQSASLLGAVRQVTVGDVPVEFDVVSAEDHRLALRIPRLGPTETGALVRVDFDAQVLRYGAVFDASVADSQQPGEVAQGVNPGDATGQFEGNRVSVATASDGGGDLISVQLPTRVFTPNGDGVNDQADITYDILEITSAVDVTVEILDLAGRRVRTLFEGVENVGTSVRQWDGRDPSGQLMPPGVYLARIDVDADRASSSQTLLLHLVY